MTPLEWDNTLTWGWKKSYPVVQNAARELLDTLPEGKCLNTTELVEVLYPDAAARGDAILRRKRMFKALRAGLEIGTMGGYWSPGSGRRYMGRTIYPPMWHKRDPRVPGPNEVECPICGSHFKPEINQ